MNIEKLNSSLFLTIMLLLVGLLCYWAVVTIQSGTEHKLEEKVEKLEEENDSLKKNLTTLTRELDTLKSAEEARKQAEGGDSLANTIAPTAYKHQTLINELEKLIADRVLIKLKSSGTRVGTVQRFLNLYNGTTSVVDNDYGPGTAQAITTFQKKEGLKADGEAGPGPFQKMIEWLKKQG